jgi:tetratricopeptide (TPR) repeat protein
MSCTPPHLTNRLALPAALLLLLFASAGARAQGPIGIGAHRGDRASVGSGSIQGRVISPTGRLPGGRIRVTLESNNAASRTAYADSDGAFNFSGTESGPHRITVDAGKDYELAHEAVYIDASRPMANVPVYLKLKPEANPALAGVPQPAVDLYLKGVEAARKNENEQAITHLSAAVAQHPTFGLAHRDLGALYLRTNQLDKAAESLKAAVKALPDDAEARRDYGLVLLEKKEFPAAEENLRAAMKQMSESAQLHMHLGVALMRQRKLEDAVKELQQSIKLGGERMGRAHYYLGGIYWAKSDFKRAADELETYLKLTPKAPDAEQVKASIKQLRDKK